MAQEDISNKLGAFFQSQGDGATSNPPLKLEAQQTIAPNAQLDPIRQQKAALRAKINILSLFQDEVKGMIDNIDKSQVVLFLTDVESLSGEAYTLITEYAKLTSEERRIENKPFAVIPVWVTPTEPKAGTYLSTLQCIPRQRSIADSAHTNVGLKEVAGGLRGVYDSRFAKTFACLSVVCSPANYDMYSKVVSHMLASGVVNNKYYPSGFHMLTNAAQQNVLDKDDATSGAIDKHIEQLSSAAPGANMLEHIKTALNENPDTAGIVEYIDTSDIVILGMHADLLGKRWYRLVEMYLKHVTEQKKMLNQPFVVIPLALGSCEPDSWLNNYRKIPGTTREGAGVALDIARDKELALGNCSTELSKLVEDFVRAQGHKQLQLFPLYPVSQMPVMAKFIKHLQAEGLVAKSDAGIASAPVKLVETKQIETIKSQSAMGNQNRLMQFGGEMINKVDNNGLVLVMVDAETIATQQYDTFNDYYQDIGAGNPTKAAFSLLVTQMPEGQMSKVKYRSLNYGKPLKGGQVDSVLSDTVGSLNKRAESNSGVIGKGILIVVSEDNRKFADSFKTHMFMLARKYNTQIDFLYI